MSSTTRSTKDGGRELLCLSAAKWRPAIGHQFGVMPFVAAGRAHEVHCFDAMSNHQTTGRASLFTLRADGSAAFFVKGSMRRATGVEGMLLDDLERKNRVLKKAR
jgi:hypothetical protein